MLTTMTRDIVIARETRKKEGHVDDQQRDGHLSTRIPLFSSRNNRLVLARPTRRFRRRVIKREKRSGRLGDGWLTWRKGSQHFFRLYVCKKKRGSREIKMRIIQDPRTKTMTLGEDNVTNNMKFCRLPESCSLKYARHYRREEEEEKGREKSHT